MFIGPAEEATRFGEKLAYDHATNARLVAQIELDNASPWASPTIDRAVEHARRLVRRLEIQRVIIAPHASGDRRRSSDDRLGRGSVGPTSMSSPSF